MESTLAALLLVTSAVVFSCIVIGYAFNAAEQSLSSTSPQMQLMNQLQSSLLNQTALFNGTYPEVPTLTPTPEP